MKDVLQQAATKLNKNRKNRKVWQSAVRVLTAVVVFCTTYALILPAITMDGETICGIEAHEHTESCYIQQPEVKLECGLDSGVRYVHSHDARCYDEQGALICTLPEIELHTHDDSCYTHTETLVCEYVHYHSADCVTVKQVLVCVEEESAGHTHDESCSGSRTVLTCDIPEGEEHTHGDSCYTTEEVICQLEESAGHSHGESCYTQQEVFCDETTIDGHVHSDDCYQRSSELTCGKEEVVLHTHGETCFDAEGNLTCTLPQVAVHNHTDACLVETGEIRQILICEIPEHIHEEACYPLESEETEAEYICGSGEHTHVEGCYDEAGNLVCTIPQHTHEAACLVEDLDLTADLETPQQWEAEIRNLELTGNWREDVLTVAESQLGYNESERNVVLADGELKGYTRYGAWYGDPYGDWSAMFVSFCLNYAEITTEYIPYESNSVRWIEKLTEKGLYFDSGSYTPAAGDLMFLDADEDAIADAVGIVAELLEENKIKVIAGDIEGNSVDYQTYERTNDGIIGYGKLPQNPLSEEEWKQAEEVATMLAQLPSAEDVQTSFQTLNEAGDKAGYEALRQELITRIEAIYDAYSAFNDLQKSRVGSIDLLEQLKEVCGGAAWQQFPALNGDGAVVSELTASGVEVVSPAVEAAEGTEALAEVDETLPENAVRNNDTVYYSFTISTRSYYTDLSYGEARVKVELVLPMTWDKAHFDAEAMTWLKDPVLTGEDRMINDTLTRCQVLTGYVELSADDNTGYVVPGSVTQDVVVKVLGMTRGEKLAVIISAAMEHGTWNGMCPEHQCLEKLSVVTETCTVYAPLTAEERQAKYEAFLTRIEELKAHELTDEECIARAQELLNQISDAFTAGELSSAHYAELADILLPIIGVDVGSIAEPSVGNGWVWMDFGNLNYCADSVMLYTSARTVSTPALSALAEDVSRSLGLDSESQIDRKGGGTTSSDNAVYVSKTIEGTSQENVFDITLQIITKDEVNEVYEEPDMAVVVVMDISNTMTSIFSGEQTVTRYDAAMTAATQFLNNFAEQTEGISKVGYVAFNTHAHEVFPMQECSTAQQAATLANTMKTKTGDIMRTAAAKAEDGLYKKSHERFTNIEAGLKMANDMLDDVSNRHKYIIFLSDGFPTTYVSSGYNGYDPYTSSGNKNNNGVFYDDVLNKYCSYGTSYSETAAIKARTLAVSLKNEGVNIFSIGVDVTGQNLWDYHSQSVDGDGFSVIERREERSYYETYGYEIGTTHAEIVKSEATYAEKVAMSQDFKDWLKGSANSGIGSGYYYDSTDQSGLEDAYKQIFAKILEINASSSHLDWVATDPMPDMGVHEIESVEFLGFWDIYGNLQSSLTGVSKDGPEYENTATFDTSSSTIHWDLKNSGYISIQADNVTNYMCTLKYRVRLKNENDGFVENQIYDTNDVTSLTYRIIEIVGDEKTVSDRKRIDFPIPAVHGYLSELNFMKVDPSGRPLSGAEFTLSHDTTSCGTCRGDGVSNVPLEDMVAVSGDDGMVTFTNIPSGHHYTLTETEVPAGYELNGNTYQVVISYDALTVTVTDADGNPLEWTQTIKNMQYYVLPETGGMGTSFFTFGGLLLIAAAALMYSRQFGRKRRKGGR